ncbi:MAG: helix-turn-helix transcriptional regulator [Hungatella sp.]|jgi:cyanate lyase|nr:helix-turn-helix transcriptional regulator [Hungatella sp.]
MKSRRMTPFGKYVVKTLTDRDMSKTELAVLVGTSPQYLSYILYGERSGEKYLTSIIAVLGLDPQKVERLTA